MVLNMLLVWGTILLTVVTLIILIIGIVQRVRGKKEKSDKTLRMTGISLFGIFVLVVFSYTNDVGKEEVNDNVQDAISYIVDSAKTGEFGVGDKRPEEGSLYVHYLDVGQGESTLLDYTENGKRKTILIDAGDAKGTEVVDYLKDLRVRQVDVLVATSPKSDHVGQVSGVIDNFRVKEIWMSGNKDTSTTFGMLLREIEQKKINSYEPKVGEIFTDGKMKIEIINPKSVTGDINNDSIGLKVTYGDVGFIFTGDSEGIAEKGMLNTGVDLSAKVLHVGNHGSENASSNAFLDAVRPEVAVYSAGEDNDKGYPHNSVIDRLEAKGIEVFGTDKDGFVLVKTDGKEYSVNMTGKVERKKEEEKPEVDVVEEIETRSKSNMLVPKDEADNR